MIRAGWYYRRQHVKLAEYSLDALDEDKMILMFYFISRLLYKGLSFHIAMWNNYISRW